MSVSCESFALKNITFEEANDNENEHFQLYNVSYKGTPFVLSFEGCVSVGCRRPNFAKKDSSTDKLADYTELKFKRVFEENLPFSNAKLLVKQTHELCDVLRKFQNKFIKSFNTNTHDIRDFAYMSDRTDPDTEVHNIKIKDGQRVYQVSGKDMRKKTMISVSGSTDDQLPRPYHNICSGKIRFYVTKTDKVIRLHASIYNLEYFNQEREPSSLAKYVE